MVRGRSRYSKHSIMANGGFGPVITIQEGVKRLDVKALSTMTIEQAFKLYKKGLAVTTA